MAVYTDVTLLDLRGAVEAVAVGGSESHSRGRTVHA
jgi:hypothetical protein